ncbi:MAG: hypothetical protein FWG20_02255 [Candidatus Cloacimonetes bacterium]|nr:hypothetical protein [Candidatus Cloacimonadota bacterium]
MKIIVLCIVLLIVSSIFAEIITLKTGEEIQATIIGKVGERLYIVDENYEENIVFRNEIESIYSGNRSVTRMKFLDKDWFDIRYNKAAIDELYQKEFEDTSTINLKPIDLHSQHLFVRHDLYTKSVEDMTEREYEIYLKLMNLQVMENQTIAMENRAKATKSISNAMWGIWGASLGIAVVCLIIIAITD